MARRAKRPNITELSLQIEEWRRTRTKMHPMPPELWDSAVAVAREVGIYATCKQLGVNYNSLRGRCGGSCPRQGRQEEVPISFVEVKPTIPAGAMGSEVELSDSGGRKLTIRLGQGAGFDLAGLVRELWNSR
jgi:hypothetical protein